MHNVVIFRLVDFFSLYIIILINCIIRAEFVEYRELTLRYKYLKISENGARNI